MNTIEASCKESKPVVLDSNDTLYPFLNEFHDLGYYPNSEQWNSITTDAKKMLIHAGAGSGKTTTLIGKIIYLIRQKGIAPHRILLLTFTRKSAEDMKARMARMIPQANKIHAGTFHAQFGGHLVRQGMDDLWTKKLLKEIDRTFLIRASMKDANVSNKEIAVEEIATYITLYKNTGIEPDEVIFKIDKKVGEVYWYYESLRANFDRMDFDDIITAFLPYASEIGKRYDAILVDEFQDVSTVQMDCLKRMANDDNMLICVGDSDQSIYSWRGSAPRYMLDFHKTFPGSVVVQMGTNYRSHAEIVQCGLNVVRNNKNRRDIDLFGVRQSENHPSLIRPVDDRDEAERVVADIKVALEEYRPSDIAVLFRNGYYAEPIITELIKEDIPFRLESDSFTIYDKPIVKALLAMMKARTSPNNLELIKQFGHLCYLTKEQMLSLTDVAEANGTNLLDAIPLCEFRYGNQKARQMVRAIKYSSPIPQKAVDDILEWYLDELLRNQGLTGRLQLEEIDYFKEAIIPFRTVDEVFTHANELRAEIEKAQHLDENVDALVLSTIHRSKGLEWPVVFVVGVIDGVLWDKKSEDIEEERRLCYVAVTRAKEHLTVSAPLKYADKQAETSFIREMKWVNQTPQLQTMQSGLR